jgi:hypothetical protein
VSTVVAAGEQLLGFAQPLSDGQIQAFLALLVIDWGCRSAGIARAVVTKAYGGPAGNASTC